MRIAINRRCRQADQFEKRRRQSLSLHGILFNAIDNQRLCQNVADFAPVIQGRVGVLKDHLNQSGRRIVAFAPGAGCQHLALKTDFAAGRIHQPDDGLCQGRLAAAAFPHQPHHFAFRHVYRYLSEGILKSKGSRGQGHWFLCLPSGKA